jgi:rod shape-determining protein MreC
MKETGFKKNLILFLILLFFSFLFLLLDKQNWFLKVKNVFSFPLVWTQGQILSASQGTKDLLFGLNQNDQEKKLFLLEGKLRQLAVEQNQLSTCLEENEKVKKLLGSPLPAKWQFLEARVSSQTEPFKINKGKVHGVGEGMMVISENILIGRVSSVEENFSLFEKVDSPSLKIPVVVKKSGQASIQARGLLSGQYKNKLFLDRVLQGEMIQKGDLVVTSGEEGWLPDLLVGQIEEVVPKSAELYQRAQVSSLLDLNQLRIVFVVVKN